MKAPVSDENRRLHRLAQRRSATDETWWISYRFVREVERLEREGRVKSRADLETRIGMKLGLVSGIRRGQSDASTGMVARFKQIYNADEQYILHGKRDEDHSGPIHPIPGRIDSQLYEPYIFPYRSPAGWKIGQMPEADPRHFAEDPKNQLWKPYKDAPVRVQQKAVKTAGQNAEASDK